MLLRLMLLFILMPLIELAILFFLGTIIGALYTVLIVVTTGILGAVMARHQGLAALSRIRSSIESGIMPANELFDGALILAGGLLLLTPGIITDIVGFTALVPQTRRIIGRWIRSLIHRRIQIQRGEIHYREVQ
ncbi:MAG: FxsA family protein [Dehalococcoidia bacterium]|nr:FxsA family protein [Dehalococcoidia bacterium]MCK5653699.1 FxsA family protein [Dehalococcoidia bacterium]